MIFRLVVFVFYFNFRSEIIFLIPTIYSSSSFKSLHLRHQLLSSSNHQISKLERPSSLFRASLISSLLLVSSLQNIDILHLSLSTIFVFVIFCHHRQISKLERSSGLFYSPLISNLFRHLLSFPQCLNILHFRLSSCLTFFIFVFGLSHLSSDLFYLSLISTFLFQSCFYDSLASSYACSLLSLFPVVFSQFSI